MGKRANGNAFLSQVVLDPEGKVGGVHSKHALWGPDANWATPGGSVGTCIEIVTKARRSKDGKTEFAAQTLKCGLGICLDLFCYWNSKLEVENHKIDKVEHALADYWHSEAVDVVL